LHNIKGSNNWKRSIIGAGSVVSKSIPSDEIWAGNPIVFIKSMRIAELNIYDFFYKLLSTEIF